MSKDLLLLLALTLSGCVVSRLERVPSSPSNVTFEEVPWEDSREPRVILRRSTNRFLEGFQCFEPMLMVVSLGIIPSYCVISYQVEFPGDGSGHTVSVQDFEVHHVVGWFGALMLAPLPQWQIENPYSDNQDPKRVVASARHLAP